MKRTTVQKTLTPRDRAKLRMFAAANGAMDPQGMDDDALIDFKAKHGSEPGSGQGEPSQGEPEPGQGEPQGNAQGEPTGEPEPSQGGQGDPSQDPGSEPGEPSQGEPRDPADPGQFNQQPETGSEPPPSGDEDDPEDDKIRRIAREEDDWRRDNEIAPALTELVNRIDSLREGVSGHSEQIIDLVDNVAELSKKIESANNGLKPAQNVTLTVKQQGKKAKPATIENAHPATETLIRAIGAGVHVLLVGPAGSGKTTLAHTIATSLGLDFYFTGAIAMEYKLSGFIDANGVFQDTQFRQAFEKGGLFLFDEVDASSAQALLAFNAALANGWADFPDGKVEKHPDFVCLAAANTYGSGADRLYVGRNQLDAASLDRFAVVDMDYDESNEHNWARAALGLDASDPKPTRAGIEFAPCKDVELTSDHVDEWVAAVQRWRFNARNLKIRHVISPRASIFGVKLLAAGIPVPSVEKMVVWKGLDRDTVDKIKQAA